MSKEFEVGVVTAHPLKMALFSALSVLRTWKYARQKKLKCRKWYGVYYKDTEVVVAQFGCLPGSKEDAYTLCECLSQKKEKEL